MNALPSIDIDRPVSNPTRRMLPLAAVVFLGFLSIGVPLPVLPIEVHHGLGFGSIVAGWVVGIQSFVTVATRHYAGTTCDTRGAKRAVMIGLPAASLAGVTYLVSAVVPLPAEVKLGILIAGRLILGFAESLFLTGTMAWGIARLGVLHTGKVMSWQGIAIYAALGLGAMVGLSIEDRFGFVGVALVTILLPLAALAIALPVPGVPAVGGERQSFTRVLGAIWQPGMAMSMGALSYGALSAFVALYYGARGWSHPGLAVAGFAGGYIAVRLLFSGLPDRLGGRRVAALSLAVEAVGQVILWLAGSSWVALLGATVTGIGFSLVFPSLGVEVMGRVPAKSRGLAVGGYVAFFDVALGLSGPVTGAMATVFGYPPVFLAGALANALGVVLSLAGRRPAPRPEA